MTISDDTIARLKAEAVEVQDADFQHGILQGLSWASDANFPEIRKLYMALMDSRYHETGDGAVAA
jgi:hypothetical protein